MFWRTACFTIALIGLAAGPAAGTSLPRIVIVMEGQNVGLQPQVNGLRDGLEELNYVEDSNVVWKRVDGATQEDLRAKLGSLLARERADVIVTLGTIETAVAKNVAPHSPIVFLPEPEPVRSGFVNTLANPGANLTGLTFFVHGEGLGKQLEVFRQLVPSLRVVTAIFDSRLSPITSGQMRNRLGAVARFLRVQLEDLPVTSTADALRNLEALPASKPGMGVFVICSGLFKDLQPLAAAAAKKRLPLFGCNAFQVAEQNVLASYAPDLYSLGYRGAWFVERILSGRKPRELPVETPRRFELVINDKTARQIGLKIPPEMLIFADRVFK